MVATSEKPGLPLRGFRGAASTGVPMFFPLLAGMSENKKFKERSKKQK
ncbi:MAG: hypothetical protein KF712_05330 [Akkermansiaceae bacterium]|nr:hypothetical protein [Akkermansiaceae bacterium]